MGNTRRRILGWTLSSLFIYTMTPAIFSMVGTTYYLKNKNEIQVPEVVTQREVPKEFDARDYLNLANSFVHKYKNESTEWCKQLANSTFDSYQSLVASNGRSDLEDKVRVVADVLSNEPHIWLQVREGNGWVNYEPKTLTPKLPIHQVRSYSRSSREQKTQLEAATREDLISMPGTEVMVPQPGMFEIGLPEYLRRLHTAAEEAKAYTQARF